MNWEAVYKFIEVDKSVPEVAWAIPGGEAGMKKLLLFAEKHLKNFSSDRNDPTKDGLSNLSPWFHTGVYILIFSTPIYSNIQIKISNTDIFQLQTFFCYRHFCNADI